MQESGGAHDARNAWARTSRPPASRRQQTCGAQHMTSNAHVHVTLHTVSPVTKRSSGAMPRLTLLARHESARVTSRKAAPSGFAQSALGTPTPPAVTTCSTGALLAVAEPAGAVLWHPRIWRTGRTPHKVTSEVVVTDCIRERTSDHARCSNGVYAGHQLAYACVGALARQFVVQHTVSLCQRHSVSTAHKPIVNVYGPPIRAILHASRRWNQRHEHHRHGDFQRMPQQRSS